MKALRKLIPILFLCELLLAVVAQGRPEPPHQSGEAADLAVAATVTSARRNGHWLLDWEVSIGNRGPDAANDVIIEAIADESLRQSLRHIRIEAFDRASCIATALVCRIEALPAGVEHRLRFYAELIETEDRRSAGLEFRVTAGTRDTEPCDNHYYSTVFLEKPIALHRGKNGDIP